MSESLGSLHLESAEASSPQPLSIGEEFLVCKYFTVGVSTALNIY